MKTKARLLEIKSAALREIETAARQGLSGKVVSIGKRIERIENLLSRYEQFLREVELLEHGDMGDSLISKKTPISIVDASSITGEKQISARERGKRRKATFLEKLSTSGIKLQQIKGSLFKAPSGIIVGIAYASEVQKDGWFLGLPADKVDYAILLCEPRQGDVFAISVPKRFFDRYGHALSQSRGQVKFNVAKRRNGYFFSVPVVGMIDVDEYQDKFDGLR